MLEESKDQKLQKLVDCGLIAKEDIANFKNLSKEQLDFFREKFEEKKIDDFLENEKIDPFVRETVSKEVVKRRRAQQELDGYKTALKSKLQQLADFVK